jgi:hypothetical protein
MLVATVWRRRRDGRVVGGRARRLLIAESDPALRLLVVQRFSREGFDVVEVAEPGDA